jgi:LysM repeat protein
MAIMRRKDCYSLRSFTVSRFFWALLLLLLLSSPTARLWAAEGSAHLTFQKAAPGSAGADSKQEYTIKKGDSVDRIVRSMGWTAARYKTIKKLNPHIADLNRIYPGQKLILTRPEDQQGATGKTREVSNYTTKEGDSITGIIISELNTAPAEAIKILRAIKQLNPEITDFNNLQPGQVIKIPRLKSASPDPATVKSAEEEKPLVKQPIAHEKYITVIRKVVEQLQGKVITSGNHVISLPESGQIVVDCAIVPLVELGGGVMVLLDSAGRMPEALADIIQSSWQNYHLVQIASGQSITSVLQKIFFASPLFQMVKAEPPFPIADMPKVKLPLDWLVTKKSPSGNVLSRLGLTVSTGKAALSVGSSTVKCGMQQGVKVCEITGDKI